MKTQKVLLELELPADKLKALSPIMKDGKIKIVMGKDSFVACNAAFSKWTTKQTFENVLFIKRLTRVK